MWLAPQSSLSVLESAGWTLASDSSTRLRAFWDSSSATRMQRPSSSPVWKKATWSQRLFGAAILQHAISPALPPASTSSRPAIPASRSASPEDAGVKVTIATCGRSSVTPFAWYDRDSSFWKTSQGTFRWDSKECSVTLPKMGSMRNGQLFERPTSAPRTDANDCSSWPTPDAGVTTRTNRSDSPGASVRPALAKLVRTWPTPRSHEVGQYQYSRGDHSKPTATLTGVATRWATPAARDWRSESTIPHGNHSPPLGRQVLTMPTVGSDGSTPEAHVLLCPAFVEALMGFPRGWTWVGQRTDCDASETQSCRSRRQPRCGSC